MITLVQATNRLAQKQLPGLFCSPSNWNYAVYSLNKILNVYPMEKVDFYSGLLETQRQPETPKRLETQKRLENLEKCYKKNICGNESRNLIVTDSVNPDKETELFQSYGWKC